MKIYINKGDCYGLLTVICEAERMVLPSGQINRAAICMCKCGVVKTVRLVHLLRGKTVSCGCKFKTKGGESNTLLHKRYKAMIERCQENNIKSKRYYQRKIEVCVEWKNSYHLFKKWALENGFSKDLRIDRIDNSKGYSPENCRFISNIDNMNNRDNTFMIDYNGLKTPFMEVVRKAGIPIESINTVRCRIIRGWNHQKAIDTPSKIGNCKRN